MAETPVALARRFYRMDDDFGELEPLRPSFARAAELLAALIRQERERAFIAGSAARAAHDRYPADPPSRFTAARRAAIEGEEEDGE